MNGVKIRAAALGAALLALLWTQTAQAQNASDTPAMVNKIVYVANAIDHLESSVTPEQVALAVFVVKMYSPDNYDTMYPNPSPNYNANADPSVVIRYMIQAQEKYTNLYKSNINPGQPRIFLTPYDAATAMLGFLAMQPGNPVAITMESESVNFETFVGNRVSSTTTPPYLDQSRYLGASRVIGGFAAYQSDFLEKMFVLAQTNPNAALVVDTFFGPMFHASVHDTAFQLLAKNTALRDSAAFNPVYKLIQPDGSMTITPASFTATATGFQTQMNNVVTASMKTLASITPLQTTDFAQFYLNPQSPGTQSALSQAQALVSTVTPMLQGASATAYIIPLTIHPDLAYAAYQQTVATLQVGADTAHLAADVTRIAADTVSAISPDPGVIASGTLHAVADGLDAVGDGFTLSADVLNVTAAFGGFGASDTEVIMEGINDLSAQLLAIQQTTSHRFDIVDANINTLYTTMNSQFSSVKNILLSQSATLDQVKAQVSGVQDSVNGVQQTLFELSQAVNSFSSDSARASLVNDLTNIDTHVRNDIPFSTQDDYTTLYSDALTYATFGDSQSAEVSPLGSRNYTPLGLQQELSSGPFPEWNINYIINFVQNPSFTTYTGLPSVTINPSGAPIANPRAWAMSVTGMMRLATFDPADYLKTTKTDSFSSGSGFFLAYNVGNNIETAVANCTVQFDAPTLQYKRSPLFDTLIQFQDNSAANVIADLKSLEASAGGTLANQVAVVNGDLTTSSAVGPILQLQNDVKILDGSRALLNDFVQFGLSHSLERVEFLHSILYSPQRLPDAQTVRDLYSKWTAGQPDPAVTLASEQVERKTAAQNQIDALLITILADTNSLNATGEPLAEVDSLLQRFGFFLLSNVGGHIAPGLNQGSLIPGDPIYFTFRSQTNSRPNFTLPVYLDASGNFNVSVPEDNYNIHIVAERYLAKTLYNINTLKGSVLLGNPATNVSLLTGDISGDNIVDNTDMTLLRDAFNNRAASGGYDPRADFNKDGSVDSTDFGLLIGAFGSTSNAPGLPFGNQSGVPDINYDPNVDANGDGSIDSTDFGILIGAFGSTASDPNYNILADLNGDGIVDASDLQLLQSNFGKRGDP